MKDESSFPRDGLVPGKGQRSESMKSRRFWAVASVLPLVLAFFGGRASCQ